MPTIDLAHTMDGLRLVSLILALAMIVWWTPSLWRVLRARHRGPDATRAIWVTLAWSILLFQIRWLGPDLTEMTRMRIWVVAQAAMAMTQIAAIYHHGVSSPDFQPRRTLLGHVALVVLCIVFAWTVR